MARQLQLVAGKFDQSQSGLSAEDDHSYSYSKRISHMLFENKNPSVQLSPPPEALLSGIAVIDMWALAALVTPMVISVTLVALTNSDAFKEGKGSELEKVLKDFCSGH